MHQQNYRQLLDAAEAELMRRLRRIREVEGERDDFAERVVALETMLADADEKRKYWRGEFLALTDLVRREWLLD